MVIRPIDLLITYNNISEETDVDDSDDNMIDLVMCWQTIQIC